MLSDVAANMGAKVSVLSLGERTADAVQHPYSGEGFSANDTVSFLAKPLTHPLPEGEEEFVARTMIIEMTFARADAGH